MPASKWSYLMHEIKHPVVVESGNDLVKWSIQDMTLAGQCSIRGNPEVDYSFGG
jgi:hypothetical protein